MLLRLLGMLLLVGGVSIVGMILVNIYKEARKDTKIGNVISLFVFILECLMPEIWSCSFLFFLLGVILIVTGILLIAGIPLN